MAKYSDIKGFTVQTLSSDTAASAITAGSWASGGALNTARHAGGGAGVSQTATVVYGGQTPPAVTNTESYNGSTWTELNDLNTARTQASRGQGGTYTSAIYGMGPGATTVESWDGTNWTEVSEFNSARYNHGIGGASSTSSLVFGGESTGYQALTETWNGTSWTETNDLNTARNDGAGVGTPSASLYVGGQIPPNAAGNTVESWDGSSWTEIAEIAYNVRGPGGFGTYTEAVIAGGLTPGPASVATVQYWNGSSWTEIADLSTASYGMMSGGTATAGLVAGFNPVLANTEEFTAPAVFNQQVEGQLFFNSTANAFKETITDFAGASWASAPSLNTARYNAAGNGLQTAGLVFGGDVPPSTGATEEFNGSAWTEKNDLNTSRARFGGSGTVTAGIAFGGDVPPATGATERWDGSSWTEVNDMNTARGEVAGGGGPAGYTAAIGATGRPSGNNATEIWDGSSWTEVNDTNTGSSVRRRLFGTTTAAIICGGGDTGTQTTVGANTESWDGTSWTEVNNLNTGRFEGGVCGIQTAGLMFGGSVTPSPGKQDVTEQWDGTSWTERADLGTAMTGNTAANSSPNAATFSAGGGTPVVATTEEWTVDLSNKTITAS
jgi:hypothetical protein